MTSVLKNEMGQVWVEDVIEKSMEKSQKWCVRTNQSAQMQRLLWNIYKKKWPQETCKWRSWANKDSPVQSMQSTIFTEACHADACKKRPQQGAKFNWILKTVLNIPLTLLLNFCSTVEHHVKLNRNFNRIFSRVFNIQLNWPPSPTELMWNWL